MLDKDYDWTKPQRKDTMYLATIQFPYNQQTLGSCASSKPSGQSSNNRTEKYYRPSKSISSPHGNKPDFQLKVDDIEGAKPAAKISQRFTRHTNPLQPDYKLASVIYIDPPPLKFIRDTLSWHDVSGSPPTLAARKKPEESLQQQKPTSKLRLKSIKNSLEVRDINYPKPQLDPLVPKVRLLPNIKEEPQLVSPIISRLSSSLKIIDIQGPRAFKAEQKLQNIKSLSSLKQEVKVQRAANIVAIFEGLKYEQSHTFKPPIEGARTNTLKKGILTRRVTNPLAPNYSLPGQQPPR